MNERMMIGMMVSQGNIKQAVCTAEAFARTCGADVLLGLQTDDLDRGNPPFSQFLAQRLLEPWQGVFLWDRQCDNAWQRSASLPQPFYTGQESFSYGGAFNRLLLLALVAEAPVLVRVDAGTAPKDHFDARLHEHLTHLNQHAIISGKYDKRIALRDDFLDQVDRPAFHQLVKRYVGVDPLNQLTGGACFTLRVESGPPAIAFPGFLPVWGSDDAFFQAVTPSVLVNADLVVERRAYGQPLPWPEYPARLACAAALAAMHQRANLSPRLIPNLDAVVAAGRAFLDELRDSFPDAVQASQHGNALCRLQDRALRLIEGYENYIRLKYGWGDVCEQITERRSILLKECHLR